MNNEKEFGDRIMGEISKRHLGMRPKWYFSLIAAVLTVVLLAAAFLTIIFLSFGFFHLRHLDSFGYLRLGNIGWQIFLQTVPVRLFIVALLGFLFVWLLVRRFDVSYKIGFGLLAAILVGGIIFFGYLLDQNQFGEQFEKRGLLPFLLKHESAGETWVEGNIFAIGSDGFDVKTHAGNDVHVILGKQVETKGSSILKQGKTVVAIGRWKGKDFVSDIVSVDEPDGDGD